MNTMITATNTMRRVVVVALLSSWGIFAQAKIVINEIAFKGTNEKICDGEDWVELLNTEDGETVDLTNYVLYDDKGIDDEDAKNFDGVSIAPGEIMLLCREIDFAFGIGSDDTVTLAGPTGVVVDFIVMPATGSDDGSETYALVDGEYKYTATPTPGEVNVYTEPISQEEKFRAQNEVGNDFFLVDDAQTFSKVVDIHISLPVESMAEMETHPAWEKWTTFDEISVKNIGGADNGDGDSGGLAAIAKDVNNENDNNSIVVSGAGKIRVKGQSTNTIPACMGFKNLPFNIEFNAPFLGMENFYLRNHLLDGSYMREHASHTILEAFGMPYLRSRPARVYLNGEYAGFYTVLEAPSQGYVMQRSFGAFDVEKTGLFKAKTGMGSCPYSEIAIAMTQFDEDSPEQYYFERGDHREDTPNLGVFEECGAWFFQEIQKEQVDVMRAYVEDYDNNCGETMVETGRVDLDYGSKSMEEQMIAFLNDKFYNDSVKDLTDSIDTEQWLRNIAIYSIMLNLDSPIAETPNNWYMAATEGGVDDWKIFQYDHNSILSRSMAQQCDGQCGARYVYWPILRPGCRSNEGHLIIGRVLNSDENIQKYLGYVQEYVDIFRTNNILDKLYDYGNDIKEYVIDDPLAYLTIETLEDYENTELDRDTETYNSENNPFLKTLAVRVDQVQKQLDAINNGTLSLDFEYPKSAVCPDWRDSNPDNYVSATSASEDCAVDFCQEAGLCYGGDICVDGEMIFEECKQIKIFCDSCFPNSECGTGIPDPSGIFVESDTCAPQLAAKCSLGSDCFSHMAGFCAFNGDILALECQEASTFCRPCFPYSRCGSGEPPEEIPLPSKDDENESEEEGYPSLFVESETCGPEFTDCAQAGPCYDHNVCQQDGTMIIEDCKVAQPFCNSCFPYSRCGTPREDTDGPEDAEDNIEEEGYPGLFVQSDRCGPELALCAEAGPCFDYSICAEDGTISVEDCKPALPVCKPCFPYSRCGSLGEDEEEDVDLEEQGAEGENPGLFVESEVCGPELAACSGASTCFDHNICEEDETMSVPECEGSLLACRPCFPNSRCGLSGNEEATMDETDEAIEAVVEEEDAEKSSSDDATSEGELSTSEAESGAYRTTRAMLSWVHTVATAGISWFLVVA